MYRIALAIFAVLALVPPPARAAPGTAPRLSIASLSDLSVPERPYDENANAETAVANALASASTQHKRVLIDLGGNWCADCRILAGIMQLPEMRRFLDAHYIVVLVDVGRFDRNLQIPARFGITKRLDGVPSILIANPAGTLLDRGHTSALDDARSMTPQAISDWLAQWVN